MSEQMGICVFCREPATDRNGLDELVCADDQITHWHDHDGSMWDRYNPDSVWARGEVPR